VDVCKQVLSKVECGVRPENALNLQLKKGETGRGKILLLIPPYEGEKKNVHIRDHDMLPLDKLRIHYSRMIAPIFC
jgi:hypothetical protein